MATGPLRLLLLTVAWCSLALGAIGVLVPGLPTVPFVLLAAWAALRSSAGLNRRLESHERFGPMLRDWRRDRAVSRRAKRGAVISMAACSAMLFAFAEAPWVPLVASATMLVVGVWLWHRPEPRRACEGR